MDMFTAARPSARVRRAANCTALWRFSDRALHQRALHNLLHVATRHPKAAEDGIIYELGKATPMIEQDIMAGVSTEGLNYKLKHSDLCPTVISCASHYDVVLTVLTLRPRCARAPRCMGYGLVCEAPR